MRITIRAHFDGRVIVPDEPFDAPVNQPLAIDVQTEAPKEPTSEGPARLAYERLKARAISGLHIAAAQLTRESIYREG